MDLPPETSAIQFCDAVLGVVLREKARCCGGASEAGLVAECVRLLSASLQSGSVVLRSGAIDRCRAARAAETQGCSWVTPSLPRPPEPCHGVFQGSRPLGAVCRSSLDCEAPLFCDGSTSTRTGICARPAGDGSPCATSADALAAATLQWNVEKDHPRCANFCSVERHRCEPIPAIGTACLTSAGCAAGQSCVQRACSAAPLGERGDTCGARPCAQGLRCVRGRCVGGAQPGEACELDFDCVLGGCASADGGTRVCGKKCAATLERARGAATPGE